MVFAAYAAKTILSYTRQINGMHHKCDIQMDIQAAWCIMIYIDRQDQPSRKNDFMSVQLSRLITCGMVLQRNSQVNIWGTADEAVTVTFLEKEYHAIPNAAGHWTAALNGLQPGGPFTLTINDIVLSNVYVGDVFLCSGQSNMQIPMRRVKHMYPEELQSPNPSIRQFTVPQRYNFHAPQCELEGGCWAGASPETIEEFSAVGYFFAKRLYERYHIPIGLILSAIGGTPIHAWMSQESLAGFPELIREADLCADDDYVARVQAQDASNAQRFFGEIDTADPGLYEKWYSPAYDDSGWEQCPLLTPWTGTGSVWLRKSIVIPPELAGKPATLFLGTVTDWDMVYVNGEAVGNTTYRYPPREYAIPSLPEGRCVITARVISKDGGCFTPGKQYLLSTEAGSFNLNDIWRFRSGVKGAPLEPETAFHYKPTGLYHGMIAPLVRYAIKASLWYQGESDAGNPDRYAEKFNLLVRTWRAAWGYDFPFLFVELPHWEGGPDWVRLRHQQWLSLEIPKTAMAAAFDLGEHNDLHPQNKQTVGGRLARCAMRLAYGEEMMPSPFEIIGYKGDR
jgi:sialate O-acetylesterase